MSRLDLHGFIQESRFTRFHFWMLFWSCFIVVFDMYDLIVYGSVLPLMMKDWSVPALTAGTIGSYGPLGMAIGAIGFGMLADRFGRPRMLAVSVALFSLASTVCAVAPGPGTFSVFRFVAGLGIGGILPTVIAMLTDYAPKRLASTFVAVLTCFFSVGGILAAFLAMIIIPSFGWQSAYWVAILPILTLPWMMRAFHDSPARLLQHGRTDRLHAILADLDPSRPIPAEAVLTMPSTSTGEGGGSFAALFRNGRALGTTMIWVAFFMCLLMINGVSTWLPGLMLQVGYALDSSLTFMIVLNLGAIVGTIVLGRLADRWGVKRILVPMFVISAASLVVLGPGGPMWSLLLVVAVTSACTMGSQNISYAFASLYYPSEIRSTAVGLASGVGRIGAIVGPTFGGYLLTLHLPAQASFVFFAVPGLIAAAAFLFVPLSRRGGRRTDHTSSGITPAAATRP